MLGRYRGLGKRPQPQNRRVPSCSTEGPPADGAAFLIGGIRCCSRRQLAIAPYGQ